MIREVKLHLERGPRDISLWEKHTLLRGVLERGGLLRETEASGERSRRPERRQTLWRCVCGVGSLERGLGEGVS